MPSTTLKHSWLTIHSKRTQPYTIDDISVIIPSAAGRYEKRWQWFWPQFLDKTDPSILKRVWIPCDPAEQAELTKLTNGDAQVFQVEPRFIVPKTLAALSNIRTRLTFRLANDIMVTRKGWEQLLLDQFNAQENLQVIGELQTGVSYPQSQAKLEEWDFIKREYPEKTTAAEYLHGSRLFAQSAVWRAYYSLVPRYTLHEHDEIFFSQLARGDGITFTNFQGANLYLAHCGITNQDFTDEYIAGHIAGRRRELENAEDKHRFTVIRP